MSDTVENLRKAHTDYLLWRQKRYDELVHMYGGEIHPVTHMHDYIVEVLNKEERGETEVLEVRVDV